jgi:hypothetical protein
MLLIIILIITLLYVALIGSFVIGFDRVEIFKLTDQTPKTGFTIVIPFRNEAQHLPILLKSLLKLRYTKQLFEIILVDDDSSDASVAIIEKQLPRFKNVSITILKNTRKTDAPKKDAITEAILNAKHDWIVTTDADCQVPIFWTRSYSNGIATALFYLLLTWRKILFWPVFKAWTCSVYRLPPLEVLASTKPLCAMAQIWLIEKQHTTRLKVLRVTRISQVATMFFCWKKCLKKPVTRSITLEAVRP